MKLYVSLILSIAMICGFSKLVNSQDFHYFNFAQTQGFQFANVKMGDQSLNNVIRYSWQIPIFYSTTRITRKTSAYIGTDLKNHGVIYDYAGDRFKKRNISSGAHCFSPLKDKTRLRKIFCNYVYAK